MMYCKNCGKTLNEDVMFCPACGTQQNITRVEKSNTLHYHLGIDKHRTWDIKVYSTQIIFEGAFWYLKDKEFYRNHLVKYAALIRDFLGMGYLKKRSYKKCILFIVGGSILGLLNAIIDKINEWVDNANFFLQWIGKSITLPEWLDVTLDVATIVCFLLGIIFLFSTKKMVEISFTNKRICIPQKSISDMEYNMLYKTIKSLK